MNLVTTVDKLRKYYNKKDYIESYVQHKLSVIHNCQEPKYIITFNYSGLVWPLPQTNLIWLLTELENDSNIKGIYTLTSCYNNDFTQFQITPLFEICIRKNLKDTVYEIVMLLNHFGIMISDLENVEYHEYTHDNKNLILIKNVPDSYWNVEKMHYIMYDGIVIIKIYEFITRSRDIIEKFLTRGNGKDSNFMNLTFSKKRVEKELYSIVDKIHGPYIGISVDLTKFINLI